MSTFKNPRRFVRPDDGGPSMELHDGITAMIDKARRSDTGSSAARIDGTLFMVNIQGPDCVIKRGDTSDVLVIPLPTV